MKQHQQAAPLTHQREFHPTLSKDARHHPARVYAHACNQRLPQRRECVRGYVQDALDKGDHPLGMVGEGVDQVRCTHVACG